MRFIPDQSYSPLRGDLIYRKEEHSFDFLPKDPLFRSVGGTTLCLGTLQIEVNPYNGQLWSVWGFHPSTHWIKSELPPIKPMRGGVKVESDEPLHEGTATAINNTDQLKTIYDAQSGWICVFQDASHSLHSHIEFTENVIAGLKDDILVSLWLKPIMVSS